ncbi:trichohyalin [Drosophila busckii]|uniref:trichohyalin n=1 Tax=Drosophila busckii TaxID=30019 RepID=UPI00083EB7DA|nr:trichohyalin [Drosophila busckii]
MHVVKGVGSCVRVLRKRVWSKMGAVCQQQQQRFYRKDGQDDGRYGEWPVGDREEGFDPRYDDRHYASHQREEARMRDHKDLSKPHWPTGVKDMDSRRVIQQAALEHQRRQERIIQENKLRWEQRKEPRLNYNEPKYHDDYNPIEARESPGNKHPGGERPGREQPLRKTKRQDEDARRFSKQRLARRERRSIEKHHARELRESRKGYKLPKSTMMSAEQSDQSEEQQPQAQHSEQYQLQQPTVLSSASRAWLEKRQMEEEAKYWHSWNTCPDERRRQEEAAAADEAADEQPSGYEPNSASPRRGLTTPPAPYDGSVRHFQTNSRQHAELELSEMPQPTQTLQPKRRRLSSMEKQHQLARDYAQLQQLSDISGRLDRFVRTFKEPTALLQSHVFKSRQGSYVQQAEQDALKDVALPAQPPRRKMAWQGLPRPILKRFDSIKAAFNRQQELDEPPKPPSRVQPPRFNMHLKRLRRLRTPMDSFSNQLPVKTNFTPFSEYTGYGRQTVCDAWHRFTKVYNYKPAY